MTKDTSRSNVHHLLWDTFCSHASSRTYFIMKILQSYCTCFFQDSFRRQVGGSQDDRQTCALICLDRLSANRSINLAIIKHANYLFPSYHFARWLCAKHIHSSNPSQG